jgi:hypothetical protein
VTEPREQGPWLNRVTAGLGLGVWMALAAFLTYFFAAMSHIGCRDSACESAAYRAANMGLVGQGVLFAVAIVLLAVVNREHLGLVLAVVIGASIVMGLIAFNIADAATR